MRFKLEHSTQGAARDLHSMADRASFKGVFDDMVDILVEGEQQLWSRGFSPNTRSTIAKKLNQGLDPRPMRATGALEAMLTQRGAPGQIATGYGSRIEFGAMSKGGNIAQYSKGKRHRRVLGTTPRIRRSLRETLLDHIVEGIHHGI